MPEDGEWRQWEDGQKPSVEQIAAQSSSVVSRIYDALHRAKKAGKKPTAILIGEDISEAAYSEIKQSGLTVFPRTSTGDTRLFGLPLKGTSEPGVIKIETE